jgi:hypothetical protein
MICLSVRVLYAAQILMALQFLFRLQAKSDEPKNPQIFIIDAANAGRFAYRRGKSTPLRL